MVVFIASFIFSSVFINCNIFSNTKTSPYFALAYKNIDGFSYTQSTLNILKNDIVQILPTNTNLSKVSFTSSNPNIATVDSNGNIYGYNDGTANITATNEFNTKTSIIVNVSSIHITLDAGHGGIDTGCRYSKNYEKDFTLDIANNCKTFLDKYSGITTNLTRTDDTFIPVQERAIIAKNQDAELLVSMHINASNYHSYKGSVVAISSNTNKDTYYKKSKLLANIILNELKNCGLRKKEILQRLCRKEKYFFDNSMADYYGIIRYSILRELPSIIIEHGFIDSSDFKYMNTYSKRIQLGIADAKALAKFYKLSPTKPLTNSPILVSHLDIEHSFKKLYKGYHYNISTKIYPIFAQNKQLSYTSSNPYVASVNVNGQVTALHPGQTTITVTTTDGSQISKKCIINVY